MQLKSLSYGYFPLNLLGMSAPETLGPWPGRRDVGACRAPH
jgi:hypothetical protein